MNWKKETGIDRPTRRSWPPWCRRVAGAMLGGLLMGLGRAQACGPDFPNWLLSQGDEALLLAPEGNFGAELARMNLGRPRFQAVPPEKEDGHAAQSAGAELADLRKALKQVGTSKEETDRICREHRAQRQQLAVFIEAQRTWEQTHARARAYPMLEPAVASEGTKPTLPPIEVIPGLPAEFADYFEGFIAWHNPALADKQPAQAAWERLLARPEAERRYKSTWAAFMLGKSWEKAAPEKAVGYFQQVRSLTRQGFRDSLGLAAASLGLEARTRLQQTNYEAAIELYLEQLATEDPTAKDSLRMVAAQALEAEPAMLLTLAKHPRTQKVLTAYVLSREQYASIYRSASSDPDAQPAATESVAARWLKAAEAAGSQDMDSAEALALAAYRANDMAAAQRWIRRAPNTPVTQWLQAKLLLRAGKLQSAATLLAKIRPLFPIIHETTNAPASVDRKDTLTVRGDEYSCNQVSAERQVQGELGVLRLARGEYTQALDLLLNAGFWMDAAYIAERVLTREELKDYVDRFWPPASAEQQAEERELYAKSEVCPAELREQIRYLLARRLTRELHGDQAREYYPADWVGAFDQLAAHLRTGWDEGKPVEERAGALFQAALITRTNGMELLGTEVAPDWHYHDGGFEAGVTGEDRSSNAQAVVVRPSKDELRRNAQHIPAPNRRFHYRYQAAELAWEAAKLLPDNTDQTAYILWQGGSFVKYRNPEYADKFYKALVRRNRKTALGAEADRQRWFPIMDEHGNILPRPTKAKPQEESPEASPAMEPVTAPNSEENAATAAPAESDGAKGYEYVVQAGDTVATILQKFAQAGAAVTGEDFLAANPGLDPTRLRVGQIVIVPVNEQ